MLPVCWLFLLTCEGVGLTCATTLLSMLLLTLGSCRMSCLPKQTLGTIKPVLPSRLCWMHPLPVPLPLLLPAAGILLSDALPAAFAIVLAVAAPWHSLCQHTGAATAAVVRIPAGALCCATKGVKLLWTACHMLVECSAEGYVSCKHSQLSYPHLESGADPVKLSM